jgi:hypothetical protein
MKLFVLDIAGGLAAAKNGNGKIVIWRGKWGNR